MAPPGWARAAMRPLRVVSPPTSQRSGPPTDGWWAQSVGCCTTPNSRFLASRRHGRVGNGWALRAEADSGLNADQWMADQAEKLQCLLQTDQAPALTRVLGQLGSAGYDFDLDHLFSTGLDALLTGLTHQRQPDY